MADLTVTGGAAGHLARHLVSTHRRCQLVSRRGARWISPPYPYPPPPTPEDGLGPKIRVYIHIFAFLFVYFGVYFGIFWKVSLSLSIYS